MYENSPGYEVSHVLSGLILSMKESAGQHIACARTSVNKRSSAFQETSRSVDSDLHGTFSG